MTNDRDHLEKAVTLTQISNSELGELQGKRERERDLREYTRQFPDIVGVWSGNTGESALLQFVHQSGIMQASLGEHSDDRYAVDTAVQKGYGLGQQSAVSSGLRSTSFLGIARINYLNLLPNRATEWITNHFTKCTPEFNLHVC